MTVDIHNVITLGICIPGDIFVMTITNAVAKTGIFMCIFFYYFQAYNKPKAYIAAQGKLIVSFSFHIHHNLGIYSQSLADLII